MHFPLGLIQVLFVHLNLPRPQSFITWLPSELRLCIEPEVGQKKWYRGRKAPFWHIEMLDILTCCSLVHPFQCSLYRWSAGSLPRHHSFSHSEGRCPWHWKEHCGCSAELQQLQVSLVCCWTFSSILTRVETESTNTYINYFFLSISCTTLPIAWRVSFLFL